MFARYNDNWAIISIYFMRFNRFHSHSPDRNCSGFSLLQTSILLTMSALVLVSVLPGQRHGDFNQKVLDDVTRLEQVEEGMKRFMALNGRRPCPADGQYDVNSNSFGLEAGATTANSPLGSCKGGLPVAPMGPDAGTNYIVAGNIPTKSLGLPDDYAFDSKGRRFTYVVDTRATLASTCYSMQNVKQAGGLQVQYKDPTGAVIFTDNVMYAYITHGPDGHGAWPAAGSTVANRINKGSTDADQLTNAGVDASFVYNTTNFTNTRVKKDRSSTYDDFVYYDESLKNNCCYGTACASMGGFQTGGEAANDRAGEHAISLDLNGDGIADIASCAPDASPGGNASAGAVYVVFGSKNRYYTAAVPLSTLNGTNGVKISGIAAGDRVCNALARGDINGDNIDDLLIGAPSVNSNTGAVYVVMGKTGTWPASCSLSGLNGTADPDACQKGFRIDGVAAGDQFGHAVAAGDFNYDDYDDVLVGAPRASSDDGRSYLMCGGTTFTTPVAISGLAGIPNATPTCGFRIDPPASAGERFGHSVTMGHIKGDKYADIIIGAPYAQVGVWWEAGRAYAICGGTGAVSTPVDATALTGIPAALGSCGIRFDGVDHYHHAGHRVRTGDIKGDGIEGVIITAPDSNPNGNVDAGSTYYVYGKTTAAATFDLNTVDNPTDGFRVDGLAGDNAGSAVHADSDINGDGVPDLVIGAPSSDPSGRTDAGAAYVVFGGTNNLSTMSVSILDGTKGFAIHGKNAGDRAGTAVGGGDFYNSGRKDVIMGAPEADTTASDTGSIFSIKGKSHWDANFDAVAIP